ncbi:MAG: peptide ABC transporter substrate-binding protein [Alphaproteobacteria bacterium]|nr:peptide ABC transporter substrate-binding protein [Alphaproteobacteria bacterium]
MQPESGRGDRLRGCRRQAGFRRAALALTIALAPAASGLAPAASGLAADHQSLSIGISQFPSSLNPNVESMAAKSYVLGLAMRPFTVYDADWRLVCLLCTTLPSFENGLAVPVDLPDGRRGVDLTYSIRPEARWGDGAPVTTDDVRFTYEVGRHPESAVGNGELYRRIAGITVKDDKTFTLHVDRLTFDYAAINDFVLLPEHLERAAFADPAQYRVQTRYATDATNPGLYNGPYRISEISAGSYVLLEPNPHWSGPSPAFQRIAVRAIENTAALEANLLSGTIDMVAGELGFPLDEALAFEKRHAGGYDFLYKPGLAYEHVDANLDNPILADRRVRQALLLGLDREAISRQLFGGREPVADGFMSALDPGYSPDVPHYNYDPKGAAALLEEAGWSRQTSGPRRNAAGQSLSLELMTTAGNRSRELIEQVLQSQWRELGVEIRIKNEPARVMFGQSLPHRRFDLAMYAWISSPENVPRSILHSGEIPSEGNGYSGENVSGWRSPEMDRLIDALEIELDRDKRRELWAAADRLYAAELPSLPLYFRSDAFILPKWLSGLRPTGNQYPTTLWVTDWRAEP